MLLLATKSILMDIYFKEDHHSFQKSSHPPCSCVSYGEHHILRGMLSYDSKYRGDGQDGGIRKLVTMGTIEGMQVLHLEKR